MSLVQKTIAYLSKKPPHRLFVIGGLEAIILLSVFVFSEEFELVLTRTAGVYEYLCFFLIVALFSNIIAARFVWYINRF